MTTPEDTQWWAPRDVIFSGWEEYDRRLKGASTLEGVFPPPALGVPPENFYTVDEDGNSDGPCTRGGDGGTGNYDTLSASTPSTQGPRLRFGLPVQAK